MRCLVTAGNTRERIDQVRDWGNIFTGNTGLAIARAVADAADVDLLTSNRQHIAELQAGSGARHAIHASPFTTHQELRGALAALLSRTTYDAVFMTAAVADYRPVRTYAVVDRTPAGREGEERWLVRDVQAGKVKSTHPSIAVLGEPTEKLIDLFRTEWRYRGLLIKFKLEVGVDRDQLLAVADLSRRASGADYLVANTLDMVTGENAGAYLLSETGHEWVPRGALAGRMRDLVGSRGG